MASFQHPSLAICLVGTLPGLWVMGTLLDLWVETNLGTRGDPLARQLGGVSTLLSQIRMTLRWGDDVPAGLGDFRPGWHPVWTPTSGHTGAL